MKYEEFKKIFDNRLFGQHKSNLIKKLANSPHRYTGIFRSTTPKTKVIQNLLHSQESKFGDAFEELIEKYLQDAGFNILCKRLDGDDGKKLLVDQLFTDGTTVYFVEQKMRDDHDTTKKTGQIKNFEKKATTIINKYKDKEIVGFFYFIDDSFSHHKEYYEDEIAKLNEKYKIQAYLVYGDELFVKLFKEKVQHWQEIGNHLNEWNKDLPELPELNFDEAPESSFLEMKDNLTLGIFIKLFSNPDLDVLLYILFPEAETLGLLHQWFEDEYAISTGNRKKSLEELIPLSEAAIQRIQNKNKDKKSH